MSTDIDLAAERAAAARRRADLMLQARAKMVMSGRRGTSIEEFGSIVTERYPDMPEEDVARVLEHIEAEQRSHPVRPIARPATITNNPTAPMPKPDQKQRILAFVREQLQENASQTADELRKKTEQILGVTVKTWAFYQQYFGPVRKELGIRGNGRRSVRDVSSGTQSPAKRSKPTAAPPAIRRQPAFGPPELLVLRFVGVSDDQIDRAMKLADHLRALQQD
jgi:hypothetical protein